MFAINAYPFDGLVIPILTFQNFVKYSTDLLNYDIRKQLFKEGWPIYTTTHNTPPATYGENAHVSNSFIANGCIIKGTVINSVISRDVIVEEGAIVKDCVLYSGTQVGKGANLQYVLSDKKVTIKEIIDVAGEKDDFIYISRGAHI